MKGRWNEMLRKLSNASHYVILWICDFKFFRLKKETIEINFNNVLFNPMYPKYYHLKCNLYKQITEILHSSVL